MTAPDEDAQRSVISLLDVTGGMNSRVGEAFLKENESPYSSNFELLQGGGLQLCEGFGALIAQLPFPMQSFFQYLNVTTGERETFVYAFPKIYKLDTFNNSFTEVTGFGLINTGDPYAVQYSNVMVIVDGANKPFYTTDGIVFQYMTWPQNNAFENTANITDIYAQGTNPIQANVGVPSFAAIYKERLYFNDTIDSKLLWMSQSGNKSAINITNFEIDRNTAPLDTAGWYKYGFKGGLKGLYATTNFLVIYARDSFAVRSGTNPRLNVVGETPDAFVTEIVNDSLGLLHHKLVSKRGNADQWFWSDYGLYTLSTSENFQTVKPSLASFPIQNLINQIGTSGLRRSRMFNDVFNGILYVMTPKSRTRLTRGRIYKLNYLVNDNRESDASGQLAWNIQDNFGMFFKVDDMIAANTDDILIGSHDRIFHFKGGSTYDNNSPIVAEHFTQPKDFGYPDHNKKIFRYRVKYESPTDEVLYIYHSFENGDGGLTRIFLPATALNNFGFTTGFSSDGTGGTFTNSAALGVNVVKAEVNQTKRGKILKGRFLVQSSTARKLKLYNVWLSYEVEGMGI